MREETEWDYSAPPLWRWPLSCCGASAYGLGYYYAHAVVSRTVCFHFARMLFKKATAFIKKETNVVRMQCRITVARSL